MPYPMPGYLEHPADLAGNLLAGFQAGSAVSRAQSQLDTEAQRTSIELASRERQMAIDHQRQQQMMEMTKAYHEATIGVRKQMLDEQQQRVTLATQAAARKYAAQRSYDQYAQQLIQQGVPEDQAYGRSALKFGPEMGLSSAPMAAALRQGKELGELVATKVPGLTGTVLREKGSTRYQYIPPDKPITDKLPTVSQMATIAKELPNLKAQAAVGGPGSPEDIAYQRVRDAITQMKPGAGAATLPSGAAEPGASTNAVRILRIRPKGEEVKKKEGEIEARDLEELMKHTRRWKGFGG